jgi:hypothetical protein
VENWKKKAFSLVWCALKIPKKCIRSAPFFHVAATIQTYKFSTAVEMNKENIFMQLRGSGFSFFKKLPTGFKRSREIWRCDYHQWRVRITLGSTEKNI